MSFSPKILLVFSIFAAIYSGCDSDLLSSKQAPVIESIRTANDIYNVNPGDTVTVIVVATNPEEGPLSFSWTASGGDLLLPHDREQVTWVAPGAGGGRYTIEVIVSNTADKSTTTSVTIEVISQAAPSVQILSPAEGDFVIQFSEIIISASAFHDNGLQRVSLFVNDSLEQNLPSHSGNTYNFQYILELPGGDNTFRVEALANNTGISGSDEVTVSVEVILPKGN
jgi:hypothetical protein